MDDVMQAPRGGGGATWGVIGVLTGAAALIMALVTIYAGPFAPQPELGVSLGELAGDTLKATARELLGRPQPAPVAREWTVDDTLQTAVVVAGVLAVLCAIFAAVFGGKRPLIVGAAALGGAAIAVQFLAWTIMVIIGAVLIMAVFGFLGFDV